MDPIKVVIGEVKRIIESFTGFNAHEGGVVPYSMHNRASISRIYIVVPECGYLDNVTAGGDKYAPIQFTSGKLPPLFGIAVFEIQENGLHYDNVTRNSSLDGTMLELCDPKSFDKLKNIVRGLHERFKY